MSFDNKQAERRQRGEDFQAELRRSWRLLPNCVRLRISDGANKAGSRPSDELILLSDINVLVEAKRTNGPDFTLNMLREPQIKGMLDFETALKRNRGLVFISFLNPDCGLDEAYAFRFTDALHFMRNFGTRRIRLEEFQSKDIKCVFLPLLKSTKERTYDLKGVERCYR